LVDIGTFSFVSQLRFTSSISGLTTIAIPYRNKLGSTMTVEEVADWVMYGMQLPQYAGNLMLIKLSIVVST
jgi:hypothetical protein